MHLALLGISGRTGRLVASEALRRGHTVAGLSRGDVDLPCVTMHVGDLQPAALGRLMAGADAVISALGTKGMADGNLHVRVMAAVVEAMQAAGVRRYVALSSSGAVLPGDHRTMLDALGLAAGKLLVPRYIADKQAEADAIRELDWTLLRPSGRLTDGPARGLRTSADRSFGPLTRTPRADVAALLVECAEKGLWLRAAPFIAGR
jgi:putative NADH-flavin reductase